MKTITKSLRLAPLVMALSITGVNIATAATVNSVLIQYDDTPPKIVVMGTDLLDATFTLGGEAIPPSCISHNSTTEQHIGFCNEIATAVPGEGSYKLKINTNIEFSVYAKQAINAPALPPPPPVDNNCACVTGISSDGAGQWTQPPIPTNNFTFCLWDQPVPPYTQQVWISGSFTAEDPDNPGTPFSWTVSALWDPNNPTYDSSNPGNSTSICALHNDTTGEYKVNHPVASDQQFDACFDWMLRYGGPCL